MNDEIEKIYIKLIRSYELRTILMGIFVIGMTLNFVAVVSNNGKMPVYKLDAYTEKHEGFWDKNEVNNFYLTDIFNIGDYAVVSLGDILIIGSYLGLLMSFAYTLVLKRKLKKIRNPKITT